MCQEKSWVINLTGSTQTSLLLLSLSDLCVCSLIFREVAELRTPLILTGTVADKYV